MNEFSKIAVKSSNGHAEMKQGMKLKWGLFVFLGVITLLMNKIG